MIWMLTIALIAGFGSGRTPTIITGENGYVSEEECTEIGAQLVDWLTQEDVHVWFKCDPVLKTAEAK